MLDGEALYTRAFTLRIFRRLLEMAWPAPAAWSRCRRWPWAVWPRWTFMKVSWSQLTILFWYSDLLRHSLAARYPVVMSIGSYWAIKCQNWLPWIRHQASPSSFSTLSTKYSYFGKASKVMLFRLTSLKVHSWCPPRAAFDLKQAVPQNSLSFIDFPIQCLIFLA